MATTTLSPLSVFRVSGPMLELPGAALSVIGRLYHKDANGRALIANTATAAEAAALAICLSSPQTEDGLGVFAGSGSVITTTGLTAGQIYILDTLNGQLADIQDEGAGEFTTIAGYALTTTSLALVLLPTGLASPGAVIGDVTITQTNVSYVSGPTETRLAASNVIDAGDLLYVDANGRWDLAANTSQAASLVRGMALAEVKAVGQPLVAGIGLVDEDPFGCVINVGSVLSAGKVYCISAAGVMSPVNDIATSDWLTICGYAKTASQFEMRIIQTGLQAP